MCPLFAPFCSVTMCDLDALLTAYADLAWWYGWTQRDIDELTLDEFERWLNEANRQVKAGYTRV